MVLLSVEKLSVRYGGLLAVNDVNVEVDEGQLVGLIGSNGAGKTSFIDALTGFTPISGGNIHLCGQSLVDLPTHQRSALGLVRTFQSLELFDELTVRENILVAMHDTRFWNIALDMLRFGSSSRDAMRRSDEILHRLNLTDSADEMTGALSLGQRKLVTIARGLASGPMVLVLDEPAAGLDSYESAALAARLQGLVEDTTSVLLVDHDMDIIFRACHRIYVLDFGKVISVGTPNQVRADSRVIEAYLGTERLETTAHPEHDETHAVGTTGGHDGGESN